MKSIKIGREEYDIFSGDYILDNGAVFQFCSGDNRVLKQKNFSNYRSLRIPKSRLKEIPFNNMKKKTYPNGNVKYFFD
jgi:hypothetical protein